MIICDFFTLNKFYSEYFYFENTYIMNILWN